MPAEPRNPLTSESSDIPSRFRLPLALLLGLAVVAIHSWNVAHYDFLGDDAFISFRYAQNLVLGNGLVWNPGEAIEGYTNFLWVILMAAGMTLGLEPEGFSRVLGFASGLGVLLLLGGFTARRVGILHPLTWLPLFALALSRTFSAWSTGGLATQFFTLLILAAQLRFVSEDEDVDRRVLPSAVLFALATLTRPEGALFATVAGALFLVRVLRGKRSIASLVRWCVPILLIVGTHLIWRHSYYGAWLPNTFHAKVNGFWPEQGLRYFSLFNEDYHFAIFIPLVVLAVAVRRSTIHRLFAASALVYCFYLFAIGGGRFEFRFLVVLLPSLYWLIVDGICCIAAWRNPSPGRLPWPQFAAASLALALLTTTHLGSIRPEAQVDRHHIESIERTRFYAERRAWEGKLLAGFIEEGLLPADLRFSAGGAGALPYYTGWPTLDFRGLNDPHVAMSPLRERGVIAHEHYASADYMRARGIVIYDSMNQLVFEDDPTRYAGMVSERGNQHWKLRGVRIDSYTLIFTTLVSEAEFQRIFGHLEILF